MQDPIFEVDTIAGGFVGSQILSYLSTNMGGGAASIGFLRDSYLASSPHGPELYFHTRSNFGSEAYFSMKLFRPAGDAPGLLQIWCNTGYDADKRVDNQPGMFAKTSLGPDNAAPVTEVFDGDWDDGGTNGSVTVLGDYKTAGSTPSTIGPLPTLDESKPGMWFPDDNGSTTYDAWILYDENQGLSGLGGSRTISVIWYTGNAMMGFVLGKVMYDEESPDAVDKVNGNLLTSWAVAYDDVDLSLPLPVNNSLGGEVTSPGILRAPCQIIRSYSDSGEVWPLGTPSGNPIAPCGTVVLNEGHIECGDDLTVGDKSAHHRPDQSFGVSHNNLQPSTFPNPRLTIHYDHTNDRRAFCRHRYIARKNGGEIDPTNPPRDWLDSGFYFPWYYAPVRGMHPGDTENNGTREYIVFPGTRGGDENADAARYAGIAFRIADLP